VARWTIADLEPGTSDARVIQSLNLAALEIRESTLRMIFEAQSGHPGGSLSCVDVLVALYGKMMHHNPKNPAWDGRDFLILSKGHAAPALYATLAHYSYFDKAILSTLRKFGSPLQGHPERGRVPGIEVSTGALGMGLAISVGIALGMKVDNKSNRVHVILGDGECEEGAIWEAAMAAAHYHLDNLVAIVDRNGLQIDGPTEKVMGLEPLGAKWESFGWNVVEINGSNLDEILRAFQTASHLRGKPTVIIAYLVKGAGVPFMEHVQKFHGSVPSEKEYHQALALLKEVKERLGKGADSK
jgi:transketolase